MEVLLPNPGYHAGIHVPKAGCTFCVQRALACNECITCSVVFPGDHQIQFGSLVADTTSPRCCSSRQAFSTKAAEVMLNSVLAAYERTVTGWIPYLGFVKEWRAESSHRALHEHTDHAISADSLVYLTSMAFLSVHAACTGAWPSCQ